MADCLVRMPVRPGLPANGSAFGTQPLHCQLDSLLAITDGQFHGRAACNRIQAQHVPTVTALEMRVRSAMRVLRSVETPNAIISGNLVGQTPLGEPLQHTVNSHTVNPE